MKFTIRSLFSISILIFTLTSSCGKKKSSTKSFESQNNSVVDEQKGDEPGEDTADNSDNSAAVLSQVLSSSNVTTADDTEVAFSLSAPVAQIMGPEALIRVYEPVFGKNPRANSKNTFFTGEAGKQRVIENPIYSYFSPDEYIKLGGTILQSVWEARSAAIVNVDDSIRHRQRLDPDYLQTVRSFLGDACLVLVNKEVAAGADHASNLIFSGEKLNAAKVSNFFGLLSGLKPDGTSATDVQAFVDAFALLLPAEIFSAKDADEALKQKALVSAYVHLCVALGSDIRVISR